MLRSGTPPPCTPRCDAPKLGGFFFFFARRLLLAIPNTPFSDAQMAAPRLDPKAHAAVLQQIDALRAKALASCNTTFHSIVDYSMCTPKDSCSPCCNKANVGCRCKD